jgi:hypothetical protein
MAAAFDRTVGRLTIAISVLLLAACGAPPEPASDAAIGDLRVAGAVATLTAGVDDERGVSAGASGRRVVLAWASTRDGETNIMAAVSNDGGGSFGSPVRVNHIEGDARVNGEQPPRVAVGQDIVVVWQSRRSGASEVRLARSVDGGTSFEPAKTVHAQPVTGARGWSSVTLDAAGRAHVVWLDGRNNPIQPPGAGGHSHSARQDIFHAVWGAGERVTETAIATDVCFCCKTGVAVAPDGAIYAAFRHV